MICYRETLLFLKLHDGYPEPVKVNFRESIFTFYWRKMYTGPGGELVHFPYNEHEQVACTVAMLREVYENELMPMRRGYNDPPTMNQIQEKFLNKADKYIENGKHNVSYKFALGRFETSIAGYHCSWYQYYPLLYLGCTIFLA